VALEKFGGWVMPSHESVLAARDYDRTITADIQSGHHNGTLEKQHEDRKTRIKTIMNVDDDANPRIRLMSSAEVNHQGLRENIFIDKYKMLY
jgi:hypothetical protein